MHSIRTNGRKHYSTWILLLLLQVTLLTPAHARVWLVLIDGSGDAPTIQEAVFAAASLDTILVGPGTYPESVQISSKTLTFLSQQGRDQTVIQFGLSILAGGKVQANGFTFLGGANIASSNTSFFVNCALVNGGYGVQVMPPGAFVNLDSCIVAHNGGAGINVSGGFKFAGATCTNSEIRDNGGPGLRAITFTLDNCVISGNGGDGVVSYAGARNFHLYESEIRNCIIKGNGGYAMTSESGQFNSAVTRVFNSTISNNVEGGMRGGSWATGYTLEDCEIFDNGGFIAFVTPGVIMRRCVIRGNAGGIRANRTPHVDPGAGAITLESSTYHDNGGGLFAQDAFLRPGRITLVQSILSNNEGGVGVCSVPFILTLSVNCTNLFANVGPDTVCTESGSNNFSLDPLYCDAEGSDLTLDASSPCAPENSPAGCGLIGALPVACGVTGVGAPGSTPVAPDLALRVSPNPIGGNGVVEWLAERPGELRLYNALGRLVAHRDLSDAPLGVSSVPWESLVRNSELAPGVYYLEGVHPVTLERRSTRVVVLH